MNRNQLLSPLALSVIVGFSTTKQVITRLHVSALT